MGQTLRVAGLLTESIVDGPGIRAVLFLQGCLRRCPGCHNPQTWDMDGGMEMEASDILRAIRSDPLVRGVTFSGGEPFLQARELAPLARALKGRGYELASYTGFLFGDLLNGPDAARELLGHLDVLIDGPYIEDERSLELRFRGSRNQRILDVQASLAAGRAVLSADRRWTG